MMVDYGKTLNLPQTSFPMRANLPTKEVEIQNKWDEMDIYHVVQEARAGAPKYILHDGPPYANGAIHIGTAMNKILKDIVVKFKTMQGFDAPYIPGWDTHGLPIEHAIAKKLGPKRHEISAVELRDMCAASAMEWLDVQRTAFKRLGVRGDWEHPYITLLPEYEAKQLDVFGAMVEQGLVYKGLRPVHWCPTCETALAEAEIEYHDKHSDSIYVRFALVDDPNQVFAGLDKPIYFVIWTTTPWTLPANVAIALHAELEYVLVDAGDCLLVMAKELAEDVCQTLGIADVELGATFAGRELEGMVCQHPFLDRRSLVILGEHVTLDAGTGCVHTAPGHGQEDFEVGIHYNLPVINPVNNSGVFTAEAGQFAGMYYEKANQPIIAELAERGALLNANQIAHQFPHCWRCKKPVMFRTTEQWFVSVDSIREQALNEIEKVDWVPKWGEDRIANMVRDRGDWCISRQRVWGVPIPVFYCKNCGKELINRETIKLVQNLFAKAGSNAWYTTDAADILPAGTTCAECGHTEFVKEKDIMDVWFDSGSSHVSVLENRDELSRPADLYLEGSDQHRGWFQSSLWTGVAARGSAPYKSVVTHGFVLDSEGRKMSKSLGNVIDPADVCRQFGADILRLWVASTDFKNDVRISDELLKQMSEVYRKIRNTARYMISNLFDFDPATDQVPYSELTELDRWALMRLARLTERVTEAYDDFDLHVFYHAVHNFCAVDMSAFYLDVIKDRIYASLPASKARRAAQTVLWEALNTLVRLIAPVLTHTAEEIWQAMPGEAPTVTVQLADWPKAKPEYLDSELEARWDKILTVRDEVAKVLEQARREKLIRSSLDARVELYPSAEWRGFVNDLAKEWPMLLIVSQVEVVAGAAEPAADAVALEELPGFKARVSPAAGEKCERCWNYSEAAAHDAEDHAICPRCAQVLAEQGE